MRVERNIRLLRAHTLFMNMGFVIPVIMPYYRDEMGLTFQDFLVGEAAFAATIVVLDVPCGWISDVWKRKHVLALGSLMELIGYAILSVAHGLPMAVLAQSVIGIGIALLNGSISAMLYESLMCGGREREYRRYEGQRGGYALYTIAMASVLGGMIYPLSHLVPVLMSVFGQLGALVAACLMDEPERHRKAPEKHPVLDVIETTHYALKHPEVGFLIVFAAVMFSSTKLIMWSQQPYYMALGLKESWYGALMAVGFVLGGFSSQMAHRLDGRVGTYPALIGVWARAVAVCLGAGSWLGLHGVGLLMVGGSCVYGIAAPRVSEAVNRNVDSSRRATVLSTQSLLTSLLFMPVSMVMGRVSEAGGVQASLVAIAGWLCVAGLCLVLWSIRRKRQARLAGVT
jgi:MFS family permease